MRLNEWIVKQKKIKDITLLVYFIALFVYMQEWMNESYNIHEEKILTYTFILNTYLSVLSSVAFEVFSREDALAPILPSNSVLIKKLFFHFWLAH